MDSFIQKPLKQRIGDLLKISELTFGDHQKWPLFRKILLDELNGIRRHAENKIRREGGQNDFRSEKFGDV